MNTNIAWFMVIFGGLIECFWVGGLKYSTELWQYILTIHWGLYLFYSIFKSM